MIVVNISQCICISNHHGVCLKYIQFCQLYLNTTGDRDGTGARE